MGRAPTWLSAERRDVFSQCGEDGVIGAILALLPERDRWCVDVGAWDGVYLSNTRNLIENGGYSAVLFEADAKRFDALRQRCDGRKDVLARRAYVGFGEMDSLDVLLAEVSIPKDFDFLSIDIDGNDYHVWRALTAYRPKVVCIEFNPTIPSEVPFVQPADPEVSQGSSLRSLVELAKDKGYELVSVLPVNAFFVDAKYFAAFGIARNDVATLRTNDQEVTYLFSAYDGTVFLRGYQQLPWHGLPISEAKIQPLPRFLRRAPDSYSHIRRACYAMLLAIRSPQAFMARLRRRRAIRARSN